MNLNLVGWFQKRGENVNKSRVWYILVYLFICLFNCSFLFCLGMEFFFGDLCPRQSSLADEEKANLELTQYESHPNATLEECPLECWQRLEAKCPSLARLASKYLCIPPCATPSQRIPHQTQITFNIKRSKLPSNLIDQMLFLHHNYQTVS